jgi:hypothetical protein
MARQLLAQKSATTTQSLASYTYTCPRAPAQPAANGTNSNDQKQDIFRDIFHDKTLDD